MPSQTNPARTTRKPAYPIGTDLRAYLGRYNRERPLPVSYERLSGFSESFPLLDNDGRDTLWESVLYPQEEFDTLRRDLARIYSILKTENDISANEHLVIERIDYCTFGNSRPFRIRVVNSLNDNADYFYVKRADASRVYGLELEHLLSPFTLHFLTDAGTIVEEHIAGIPGDQFIAHWMETPNLKPIRLAKELVKFNERCFLRLLGDMRCYNFVVDLTPDFEGVVIKIRAMDFDQQSHHGRKSFYIPQFFLENNPLNFFCRMHLNATTVRQYRTEEKASVYRRASSEQDRLGHLTAAMRLADIAPRENILQLRTELAEHYRNPGFLQCDSMGALVQESLRQLALAVQDPARYFD